MSVDVLYLSWNRLGFTEVSFRLLIENTNWDLVDRLVIYDDESDDGTYEFLDEMLRPQTTIEKTELVRLKLGSPVRVMNRYLERTEADWFAKIDNDIAVPPGWLEELLGVVERNPEIELLGMEAGRTGYPGSAGGEGSTWEGPRGFVDGSHIGGVGLMRVEAFKTRPAISARGRFGFTQWQDHYRLVRGWICPDLMVPQLDRVPIEPYASLSAEYDALGWQRPWPVMDARWCAPYYDWLPASEEGL